MLMPEDKQIKTVAVSTLIGLLGSVPIVGGGFAGAIQGVAEAASRARDEDWWAMVAARLTLLEADVQAVVRFDDPEFVAAAHRFIRAARESADEEKRERLAAALTHAGSWSELPRDDRERMERLVIELTSREIGLLRILADPRGWLTEQNPAALATYEGSFFGSFWNFVEGRVIKSDLDERAAVRSAVEALQMRGLVGVSLDEQVTGEGVLRSKASRLGWEFVHYLERIGN